MDYFEEATERLKQQLNLHMDKDVAEALGLSKRAWVGRKHSGKFPIKEVFTLTVQRPELKLDAEFIVTGTSAYITTKTKLETRLVQCYRICNTQERAEVDSFLLKISDLLNLSGEEITRRLDLYDAEIEMYR